MEENEGKRTIVESTNTSSSDGSGSSFEEHASNQLPTITATKAKAEMLESSQSEV